MNPSVPALRDSEPQPGAAPLSWKARRVTRPQLLALAVASGAIGLLVTGLAPGATLGSVARQALAARERPGRLAAPPLPPPNVPLAIAVPEAIRINGETPFAGALGTMSPFPMAAAGADRARAVDCLAAAVYYEAGDDRTGQEAVAQVVLNRVRHAGFPDTVCGVVFQGSERKTGCQFTFTCDGALARVPSSAAWTRAQAVAGAALAGKVAAAVGDATHYHADYVVPYWSASMDKLAKVGAHIFYRWRSAGEKRGGVAQHAASQERAFSRLAFLSPFHVGGDEARQPGEGAASGLAHEPPALAMAALAPTVAGSAGARPARPDGRIMIAADMTAPAGRWAVAALERCRGRSDCQVVAWSDAAALAAGSDAARPALRPVFVFIRDHRSGQELALWDCARIERASAAECLPDGAAAVAKLVRDRSA